MRRLLVNDALSQLGEHTFWHDLQGWFKCETVTGPYDGLADKADAAAENASLIIRNASWFGPMKASQNIPTISLLQDILDGPPRLVQEMVIRTSSAVVFNSRYTESKYRMPHEAGKKFSHVIPLPVNFGLFEPGNPMGLQQALGLPSRSVVWVGAHEGAAGYIKGWDIFLAIVRANPHISFVAVFKDSIPEYAPYNLRMYARLPQEDLVRVIGACTVGLCTSRQETQHLAGIEMGACGLHLVVPEVGTYWKRDGMPGVILSQPDVTTYSAALSAMLKMPANQVSVREYWRAEFDRPVVEAAWRKLVEEVES